MFTVKIFPRRASKNVNIFISSEKFFFFLDGREKFNLLQIFLKVLTQNKNDKNWKVFLQTLVFQPLYLLQKCNIICLFGNVFVFN